MKNQDLGVIITLSTAVDVDYDKDVLTEAGKQCAAFWNELSDEDKKEMLLTAQEGLKALQAKFEFVKEKYFNSEGE